MGEGVKDCAAGYSVGQNPREAADSEWQHQEREPAAVNARAREHEPEIREWPILGSTASYGLVGEIARCATATSEADPVAVMMTAHAWAAAAFGRSRFYRVGDTLHHARFAAVLVGASSRARKGTSFAPVQRVFRAAEAILRAKSELPFPSGLPLSVVEGLSTGEGLIAEIRDARNDEDKGAVTDKRLLVVEGEFGKVLHQFQRPGNTLSAVMRLSWDGSDLGVLTKTSRERATAPHICIVGHITRHELNALFSANDVFNGVANRLLWAAVRRSQLVPFAKPMSDTDVAKIASELARVIEHAHRHNGPAGELVMSNSAADFWVQIYAELTQDHPGVLGAVTSRAEAQTIRLAMNYALLDGADLIELKHLEAALCCWRYCFDSAAFIFNGAEIDPVAHRIVEALREGPKSQSDIHAIFARNVPKSRIDPVLVELQERGRIRMTSEKTRGAPRRVWSLIQ